MPTDSNPADGFTIGSIPNPQLPEISFAAPKNRAPDLRDHMLKTYGNLRRALVVVGLGLPLVLVTGGKILDMPVQDSMSQYYHADSKFTISDEQRATLTEGARIKDELVKSHRPANPTEQETLDAARLLDATLFARPGAGELRDWFVGALFVTGILLIVYKGFLPDEDRALSLAGMFAMGVAVFHMPWGEHRSWIDEWLNPLFQKLPWEQHLPSVHYLCAVLFFLCLGYVCFWCGSATLDLPGDPGPTGKGRTLSAREKTTLRWAYRGCGAFMASSILVGPFVSHVPGVHLKYARVFIIELMGVLGFVAYWALKSWELSTTGADRLSAKQELELVRSANVFEGHKLRQRSLVA